MLAAIKILKIHCKFFPSRKTSYLMWKTEGTPEWSRSSFILSHPRISIDLTGWLPVWKESSLSNVR